MCADAIALRASLDKLRHVRAGNATAAEIKADVKQAQAALAAFAREARGQYQNEITEVTTSLGTIKQAVASSVPEAIAELGVLNATEPFLLTAVNARCPSISPSLSP